MSRNDECGSVEGYRHCSKTTKERVVRRDLSERQIMNEKNVARSWVIEAETRQSREQNRETREGKKRIHHKNKREPEKM